MSSIVVRQRSSISVCLSVRAESDLAIHQRQLDLAVRLLASASNLAGDVVLLPFRCGQWGWRREEKHAAVRASEKKLGEMRREMRGFKKLSPDGN